MSKDCSIEYSDCQVHPLHATNMSDHQSISIIIKCEKSFKETVDEITQECFVPKYAWNNENFIDEYRRQINLKIDLEIHDANLNKICNTLFQCGTDAFKQCFPEKARRNLHSKNWWTPELSQLKESLNEHFNLWKMHQFSKDPNNVYYNGYLFAPKHFRKAVKLAQNNKVYESLFKMDMLKSTHPRKFWKKVRQLRTSDTKRTFDINGKQSK